MRIAQVAPLFESVPPRYYGGTERVVSYLTEELVRLGHDVTLYASGDSITDARLIATCPAALRLYDESADYVIHHFIMVEQVLRDAHRFDIIHFHVDYLHFPFSRRAGIPRLTTLHGRLDLPDLVHLYHEYPDEPVTSISDAQRTPLPWLNWAATIHHGLPPDQYTLRTRPGEYLAFLGRVSPEKGLDRAIEIARRARMPLRIAGKVDPVDRAYYRDRIQPLLEAEHVEYVGEIGDRDGAKDEFLGRARALLFPIDWPEPFGLVMIEAMACGTPTIAYPCGSVPEVLEDGVTGYLVEDIESAVVAVERLDQLSRRRCREVFEERFSVRRMATDYVAAYRALLEGAGGPDAQAQDSPKRERHAASL